MKLQAYTPFNKNGDLGKAYNLIMERLPLDEWALFLDHDIIVLDNSFWSQFYDAITEEPDVGAFTCYTNSILNQQLIAPGCPATDSIVDHTNYARSLSAKTRTPITSHLSGFCFATSKRAWLKAGRFMHGFGNVDIAYGQCLKNSNQAIKRLDGVYVYHRRLTNGFKGVNPPTKSGMPAASTKHIPPRPPPLPTTPFKLAVIIPSCEEPITELTATVRSYREHGADEIIVIDDLSTIPITYECGATLIVRNKTRQGAAYCRHLGTTLTDADVYVWSDAHCRVRTPSLRQWAYEALRSNDLLCAAHTSANNDSPVYGATFHWRPYPPDYGFAYVANGKYSLHPECLVGSVYAINKTAYAKCQWPSNVGFGYNEPGYSLIAHTSNTPITCYQWFLIQHEYRTATNFKAPYKIETRELYTNRHWSHYLAFGERLWKEFFSHCPGASQSAIDSRISTNRINQCTDYELALSVAKKFKVRPVLQLNVPANVKSAVINTPGFYVDITKKTSYGLLYEPKPGDPDVVTCNLTATLNDGTVKEMSLNLKLNNVVHLP